MRRLNRRHFLRGAAGVAAAASLPRALRAEPAAAGGAAPARQAVALCVGLNFVSRDHYRDRDGRPWSGDLNSCELDARTMQAIAAGAGFYATTLLSEEATFAAVRDQIEGAADSLASGDIFLLTFSGHGAELEDTDGDEKSKDRPDDVFDEAVCLFDLAMTDDALNGLFRKFKQGVRVAMFSDTCHSGTLAKAIELEALFAGGFVGRDVTRVRPQDVPKLKKMKGFMDDVAGGRAVTAPTVTDRLRIKSAPPGVSLGTFQKNKGAYLDLSKQYPGERDPDASVILVSACQDEQFAYDGPGPGQNSLFTAALKAAWAEGAFTGNYHGFRDEIAARLTEQTPNYYVTGAANKPFEAQRPFTV